MLERQESTGDNLSDERSRENFSQQLDRTRNQLLTENRPTFYIEHKNVLEHPTAVAEQINTDSSGENSGVFSAHPDSGNRSHQEPT